MTTTIPINNAVGMPLAHDITEINKKFKGRAFKKGHIIKEEDISHLKRIGKEYIYVLKISTEEIHENEAAFALAQSLMGEGVEIESQPKEGKINIIASRDGLLKIHKEALKKFNMLGEVMCATLHTNTVVNKGQCVAATRAIPLLIKKEIVNKAVKVADEIEGNIIEVKALRKPKVGLVITGNEIYNGIVKDAFAPVINKKIKSYGGEIIATYFAPDDPKYIEKRLRELLKAGADLLITTGGMSVDPDDVTRFAIRNLVINEFYYGSAVLPGAMFLVAYFLTENAKLIPILSIPACGMYSKITVFDIVLPRILAGEHIGREEIAEMGHGGYCFKCKECRYPVCPFGK